MARVRGGGLSWVKQVVGALVEALETRAKRAEDPRLHAAAWRLHGLTALSLSSQLNPQPPQAGPQPAHQRAARGAAGRRGWRRHGRGRRGAAGRRARRAQGALHCLAGRQLRGVVRGQDRQPSVACLSAALLFSPG